MTIRVLLDASTTMVRSALKATLRECSDIEIFDADDSGPPSADIDVVVLEQRRLRDFRGPLAAIAQGSRLGIVAIDDDGQAGDLYRIRHSGWQFAPGKRGGLADAIRAVASGA
jgi:hypothetical protein